MLLIVQEPFLSWNEKVWNSKPETKLQTTLQNWIKAWQKQKYQNNTSPTIIKIFSDPQQRELGTIQIIQKKYFPPSGKTPNRYHPYQHHPK